MANLIIPGQHKPPVEETPAVPHWETYDTEFDDPALSDPKMAAAVAEYEKKVISKSHSRHVEDALMEYERNYVSRRQFQWEGQRRWIGRENEEMRLVRIVHPYHFIARLNRGGVRAEIKNDYSDRYAARGIRIWLNPFIGMVKYKNVETDDVRKVSSGLIGVNAWINDAAHGAIPKTITSLQYPYGPEYSIMRFDEYNVPTKEKYRGWRTALLSLILAGVLTEAEADACFGKASGVASEFYREQLFAFRSHNIGLNKY
jgi:hypothetical protein